MMIATAASLQAEQAVVEEVYRPAYWSPRGASSWEFAIASPLRVGARWTPGFLMAAQSGTYAAHGTLDLYSGLEHARVARFELGPRYFVTSPPVVLATPHGLRLLTQDSPTSDWVLLDAASWSRAATIPASMAVPGYAYIGIAGVRQAGDLNRDGYDDFYTDLIGQDLGGVSMAGTALIDGASLQRAWLHLEPGHPGTPALRLMPTDEFDLDGDSVADRILLHYRYQGPAAIDTPIVALSGADGGEIWRTTVNGWGDFHAAELVPDLTGDGVADLLASRIDYSGATPPQIFLFHGGNGGLVWSQPVSSFSGLFPDPDGTQVGLEVTSWLGGFGIDRNPRTGQQEIVVPIHPVYNYGPDEVGLVSLSISSGAPLGVEMMPVDLWPWTDDPLFSLNGSLYLTPLGDIDRDGLTEWSATTPALSWSPPGGSIVRQVAVVGRPTLAAPASAQIGTSIQVEIGVPAAQNMQCVLLASTVFDKDGGAVIDGWKTHLSATNPVLRATLRSRAYTTTLDALGRGVIPVHVPPFAFLAGQTLFLRAIVLEPGSADKVYTLSSVATVEIL